MKRLIAAGALVIFVIAVYIIGFFNIKSTCEETTELLKDCVTAYKNGEDVNEYSERLEKFWGDKEKILSVFTNHEALDEVELLIRRLSVHGNYKDSAMFYDCSCRIETLIHQIKEDSIPGMLSIV